MAYSYFRELLLIYFAPKYSSSVMTWPKWLSYYLFSFSFSFLLIRKLVDMQDGITKKRCMEVYK